MATGLEALEAMVEIQGADGNWDVDPYMHGLYNGLVLARHVMRGDHGDVPYRAAPRQWGIHRTGESANLTLDDLAAAGGSA